MKLMYYPAEETFTVSFFLIIITPIISHVHLIIDDNKIFLALAFFKTAFSFPSLLTIVHFTSLGGEN